MFIRPDHCELQRWDSLQQEAAARAMSWLSVHQVIAFGACCAYGIVPGQVKVYSAVTELIGGSWAQPNNDQASGKSQRKASNKIKRLPVPHALSSSDRSPVVKAVKDLILLQLDSREGIRVVHTDQHESALLRPEHALEV